MDLRALDETELLDRSRRGESAAFGELARRHARDALRVAHVVSGGSAADAEDVVQEAMVKAYRALDRFRAEAPFRPWVLRIVANEAHNRRRSAGRRRRLVEQAAGAAAVAETPSGSVEAVVVADESTRALLAAVGRLRDQDRAVIALRYFAELSEAETAAALGCPPGTVKSRLARALGRLRPLVERPEGVAPEHRQAERSEPDVDGEVRDG